MSRGAGGAGGLPRSARAGEAVQYLNPRPPHDDHTPRIRVTIEHKAQSGASYVNADRAEVYATDSRATCPALRPRALTHPRSLPSSPAPSGREPPLTPALEDIMTAAADDPFARQVPHRALTRRGLLRGTAALGGATALTAAGATFTPAPAHAAESVPAWRLREIYEVVKTPHKHGMVLPPPGDGHYDSPSVFRHDGAWYMFYILYHGGGYETLLARSADLLHWEPQGTILPFRPGAWDAAQAAGYAALQDTTFGGSNALRPHDGRYWLSYIGGATFGYEKGELSIGVAHAGSPVQSTPWQRRNGPVLRPSDPGARWFERSKLYKSNIIEDPDRRLGARYVMYYNATGDSQAGNSGTEYMTMAVSDDLVNWRRHGADPVLSAAGDYINRVVGDPQVIRVGDVWVMSFWSRLSNKPGTGVFNSFAGSYDLVNWTKWEGEVLLTTTVPYERQAAHKPWIIRHNGVTYQFYSAVGDQGFGIAVATSRDLRAPQGTTRAYASYTYLGDSPGEAIDGVVSHTQEPENRWTAWDSPNRSDWLSVEYAGPRTVSGVTLEIYDDHDGVRPPASYNVEYWTGSAWRAVPGQSRMPADPGAGANTVRFPAVSTDKVRVFFDHRGGGVFSGVTELRVLA